MQTSPEPTQTRANADTDVDDGADVGQCWLDDDFFEKEKSMLHLT
jgi:hypothetical protein